MNAAGTLTRHSTTPDLPAVRHHRRSTPDDGRVGAVAPERSLIQRMEALSRANDVRGRRATLKRDLKAGRADTLALICDPPEYILTMKLFDLLFATPKWGRVKVNKTLSLARVSPSKTVGGLSDRQRAEIAALISYDRRRRMGGVR